jgi:hypothetical protein
MEGVAREMGKLWRRRWMRYRGGEPEVGGGADGRGPAVSDQKRGEERGAGPRAWSAKLGHAEEVGCRAGEGKKKRKEEGNESWAAMLAGSGAEKEKRWVGLEKEKGREKEEGLESFLFLNLLKLLKFKLFFKLLKFKLFSKHFKPFQNF